MKYIIDCKVYFLIISLILYFRYFKVYDFIGLVKFIGWIDNFLSLANCINFSYIYKNLFFWGLTWKKLKLFR